MKFCIFSDNHFCSYSSIIRSRGKKFTTRLENQIDSLNFVERTAEKEGCDYIVCLGDFFDRSDLNAEETTCLKEISWSKIPHYFLVGNHEIGVSNNSFNTAEIFNFLENSYVISEPAMPISNENILFLPYQVEDSRKNLLEYVSKFSTNQDNLIIFSHNEIAGISYGAYTSKIGFSVGEIENSCRLFLNGHLHNNQWVTDKILNVGNLTGQNFSEDALKYDHFIIILDTDNNTIVQLVNPFAFNFYSVDLSNSTQSTVNNFLANMKNNAVLSATVTEKQKDELLSLIQGGTVTYKITTKREIQTTVKKDIQTISHTDKFRSFILEKLGADDIVMSELEAILA